MMMMMLIDLDKKTERVTMIVMIVLLV